MLLIRKAGETDWITPKINAYSSEQALQTLIEKSPDLLPGSNGNPMVVVNELAVPTGFIDLVGVDASGTITIVECKLRANSEIRRQVVGQVLAYASGLWHLSYEEFDKAFTERAGVPLAEKIVKVSPIGWNEEEFRANIKDNLSKGHFRLVIAVDEITDELKGIVQYLNQHTVNEVQVLALELRYIADEGVEILIPAIYGEESSANKTPGVKRQWNETSVLAALEKCCSPAGFQAIIRLLEFTRKYSERYNYGATALPYIAPVIPYHGKTIYPLSIYEWPEGKPRFVIDFTSMRGVIPNEVLTRLANQLRTIPGARKFYEGLEKSDFNKRPGLLVDKILTQPGVVEILENALTELLQPASQLEKMEKSNSELGQ